MSIQPKFYRDAWWGSSTGRVSAKKKRSERDPAKKRAGALRVKLMAHRPAAGLIGQSRSRANLQQAGRRVAAAVRELPEPEARDVGRSGRTMCKAPRGVLRDRRWTPSRLRTVERLHRGERAPAARSEGNVERSTIKTALCWPSRMILDRAVGRSGKREPAPQR